MKVRDPVEKEIWCNDCNAYLFSMSIYDNVESPIPCPNRERCREEAEEVAYDRNVKRAYTGQRFWK